MLSCGGQASEVTAFGTCRCVSGQFRLALLSRKALDSISIPNEAGHKICHREKTQSIYVGKVMRSEIAGVLQKKKPASLFRI